MSSSEKRGHFSGTCSAVKIAAARSHFMSDSTIILHGLELSGHCHRVAMFLQMLGLNHRFVPVPPETAQAPAFLKISPLGQIPALQDGDLVLVDSNAILVYLAKRYSTDSTWLPTEPVAAAQVQRWLS